MIIFLDDNEIRQARTKSMLPSIVQTRTADETIEAIKKAGRIDYLFLDHDLGGEIYVDSSKQNTGMTVAKWLSNNKKDIGLIVIHSFNHDGAYNMLSVLIGAGYTVTKMTFMSHGFDDLIGSIQKGMEK